MSGPDESQPVTADLSAPPLTGGPTWERLEDQLGWYDRKSSRAQAAFKRVKVGQLMLAAGVPVVVAFRAPGAVAAILGALVVVLEGVQQLYQWQANWVQYRSTHEALKHEQYLYLAQAGPYSGPDSRRVLAERIEGLISQEHAKWSEGRHQGKQPAPDTPAPDTPAPDTPAPDTPAPEA